MSDEARIERLRSADPARRHQPPSTRLDTGSN